MKKSKHDVEKIEQIIKKVAAEVFPGIDVDVAVNSDTTDATDDNSTFAKVKFELSGTIRLAV